MVYEAVLPAPMVACPVLLLMCVAAVECAPYEPTTVRVPSKKSIAPEVSVEEEHCSRGLVIADDGPVKAIRGAEIYRPGTEGDVSAHRTTCLGQVAAQRGGKVSVVHNIQRQMRLGYPLAARAVSEDRPQLILVDAAAARGCLARNRSVADIEVVDVVAAVGGDVEPAARPNVALAVDAVVRHLGVVRPCAGYQQAAHVHAAGGALPCHYAGVGYVPAVVVRAAEGYSRGGAYLAAHVQFVRGGGCADADVAGRCLNGKVFYASGA